MTPVSLSPTPKTDWDLFTREISPSEYRHGYVVNPHISVETLLIPFLDDDGVDISILSENNWGHVPEDDHHDGEKTLSRLGGYKEKMKDLRHVWENAGYYDSHPDHNAANASEELKEMLQSHHRLGPVLKEYKLYVNPSKVRTFLLQFPNRDYDQEYRALNGQKPLELRIKPKCGLVELDIPMNIHSNYDQERGIQYGEALRKSRLLQQGGSHGLAGGLGVDTKLQKEEKNAPPLEGPSTEKLLEHFDDANNKGHVMNKITLGGMIVPFKDGDPIYMTATFREGEFRPCIFHCYNSMADHS